MTSRRTIILLIIVVLVLLLAAYLDFRSTPGGSVSDTASSTVIDLSTLSATSSVHIPGATITLDNPTLPAPSLDRPIVFHDTDPESVHATIRANMQTIIAALKKDPSSFENWNNLALYRKTIGDYAGARDIWDYLSSLAPSNNVSFLNNGFLYGYYLHDNVQAEKNFKTALANDPASYEAYQMTFEFYRDVLKDSAKARALIATAKKNIPAHAADFDKLLATLTS